MMFVTDFADQAVVLPMAAGVLAALLVTGWRRGALAWAVGVGGVLGTMLVLKLLAMACVRHLEAAGVGSPSGHTACAAVVYGGLVALLAGPGRARGWWTAGTAAGFAVAIGATRLALHMHTLADVLVGGPVGVAGALAIWRLAGERPARVRGGWLVGVSAVVLLGLHGQKLQAESRLHWLALDMWPFDQCG